MRTHVHSRRGRSSLPAFLLAVLAVVALLALAGRSLTRSRRRARRRNLLAMPPQDDPEHPREPPTLAHPDEEAVNELREQPR